METRSLFVDTSAWIALSVPGDERHARAKPLWRAAARARRRPVTTNIVVAETHAYLLSRRGRREADGFLDFMLEETGIDLVWADAELTIAARDRWLRKLHDKAISLADAISFETMDRWRIAEAFAFDHDFVRAGFRLLK